ncbi:aspartyl-tRNA(Asn)/glutamyl-tRNA(Gln) amidotransferase subunit A [Stella humosa]|uniref:Aspartyl-tRNA(Asn)/glutamyl-tRNA(Gln) amidotransferase subunit A n=1 Tax=Stella humosa TaxID=94 RepID=A0A3N1MB35_9PROT|nr:amidase [Stella humosa]ROP99916.1 aspartyl-tRNA(Asn)/glutamyl-tRNA(Gln) amidotransferase subunit A [Stella humosa]BBK30854.1 amidase [Stella humosa]
MTSLTDMTIAGLSALIGSKQLSPVELVDAYLARIAAIDGDLSAYILVTTEEAKAAARTAEAEIAAGNWRGPLHGIPIGLKDIYSTKGIPTTAHSRLLKDNVPSEDAETVARLAEAGAISLGKLSTHEFAFGGPSPDLFSPPARNPWNRDLQPGGSSSGSGVAVASGMCAGAMGSDTGGSIRGPAGFCGLVGLKPTYGLVSRRGVLPLSWTLDHAGPMTWTAQDCALMMEVLAGHDPADPASVNGPVPDFKGAIGRPVEGMRIGVAKAWHESADPELVAAIDKAAAVLAGQGAIVDEVTLPDLMDFHAAGRIILLSEGFAIHQRHLRRQPEIYGALFRDRMRLGAFISADQYIQAIRFRRTLVDQMNLAMAPYDAILTATQYGPPDRMEEAPVFPFFGKPYFTMPFNVTGQPAAAVPCGFYSSGMPISMQVVGKAFADDVVLAVAHAYEQAAGDRVTRPAIAGGGQ